MKKIGITQRMMKEQAYREIRDCLDIKWSVYVKEMGMFPVILPSAYPFSLYIQEVHLDGVILSGGNNLSSIDAIPLNRQRDHYEMAVIRTCLKHEIPLMGVCRGMQLIGEYFGVPLKKVDHHVALYHTIHIQENSILSMSEFQVQMVNSYHQYALSDCPQDFQICAISDDGIIEAMEHTEYKIYTQMWHPEREDEFCEWNIAALKGFFD